MQRTMFKFRAGQRYDFKRINNEMSLPFVRNGKKTRPRSVINNTHTTSGPAEADDFGNLWENV